MIPYYNAKIKNSIFTFILFASLFSCKKDLQSVGADFVGVRNGFVTKFDTTFDLTAYTVRMDSVVTSNLTSYALGAINDPIFGITQASLIMQYGFPDGASGDFHWGDSIQKLDSVVLQLRFRNEVKSDGTFLADYYGDVNAIHTLNVYRLTEDLNWDSVYYSRRAFLKENTPIGTWTGKFNFIDTTTINLGVNNTFYLPPHVRIKMNDAFTKEIYDAEKNGYFATTDIFKAHFKGFVIIDESNLVANQGAIVFVKLNSDITELTAYHDSTDVNFHIIPGFEAAYNYYAQSSTFGRFVGSYNNYQQVKTPANILQTYQLPLTQWSGQHRDTCYVQSLGGAKLRLELPNLYSYFNNPKLIINGAEITFSLLENSTNSTFTPPVSMLLVGSDSLGKNVLTLDAFENYLYQGGTFNPETNQYKFNIVRHLQYLVDQHKNGFDYNYGMNMFISSNNPVSADRVVIDTHKKSGKLKLKLTYTVIK